MTRVYSPSARAAAPSSGCGCGDPSAGSPAAADCDCDLPGFERPSYFRGHLLTDADLILDQRYAREKRRLTNRALHGHGVVCGLALTCHDHCPGHVVVGQGYALDPCGNDLVVCHPQPLDVKDALWQHKWLSGPAKPGAKTPDPCLGAECFYVVARYSETPGNYVTPLTAGCRPDADPCRPTRVSEGVKLDLMRPADLPSCEAAADKLREQFDGLKWPPTVTPAMLGKLAEMETTPPDPANVTAFTEARDFFNRVYREVYEAAARYQSRLSCHRGDPPRVSFPDLPGPATAAAAVAGAGTVPGSDPAFQADVTKAIVALRAVVEWAYRLADDALTDLLIPECPAVCGSANIVVLGRVEVAGGELVRVCNHPRRYVGSAVHSAAPPLPSPSVAPPAPGACCSSAPWQLWKQASGAISEFSSRVELASASAVARLLAACVVPPWADPKAARPPVMPVAGPLVEVPTPPSPPVAPNALPTPPPEPTRPPTRRRGSNGGNT